MAWQINFTLQQDTVNPKTALQKQGWVSAGRNLFLSYIRFKPVKTERLHHGLKIAGVTNKAVNHINHL